MKTVTSLLLMLTMDVFILQSSEAISCYSCRHCDEPTTDYGTHCVDDVCITKYRPTGTNRWCGARSVFTENGCRMVGDGTLCACDTELCNDEVTVSQPQIECYHCPNCDEPTDGRCTHGEVCVKDTRQSPAHWNDRRNMTFRYCSTQEAYSEIGPGECHFFAEDYFPHEVCVCNTPLCNGN